MAFKFEQLRVWQLSLEFGEKINLLTDQFPKKELFNLSSQIRRAADSIGLNIAEGSTGHTNAEQKRFLIFANRSALEVVACLIKARSRKYLDETTFKNFVCGLKSILYENKTRYSKQLATPIYGAGFRKIREIHFTYQLQQLCKTFCKME